VDRIVWIVKVDGTSVNNSVREGTWYLTTSLHDVTYDKIVLHFVISLRRKEYFTHFLNRVGNLCNMKCLLCGMNSRSN